MINKRLEPVNGKRWRQPSRLPGILFTDRGLLLTKEFLSINNLSGLRHVRVFIWVSRSRTEFWLQFQRSSQANTVVMQPAEGGTGAMCIKAPGLLAGGMSRLEGAHHYKLSNRAHATVFVISLKQSL